MKHFVVASKDHLWARPRCDTPVVHDSPGQGPSALPSPAQRAGFARQHLITRAKGPAICYAPNQHARIKESNGRTVGPTVFHLVRYPGRWPRLSKCPGLRPSIQNELTRKRLVFNICCDANRLRETGQHALSPRHSRLREKGLGNC